MTSYTYLGYGITNENGVAQLKYDENGDELEHSYTGSGVGEVDVVASLDDPDSISDSSLVSETYELYDCIFFDKASSTSYNDTGWSNARMTLTREDTYKHLVWDGTNNGGAYYRSFVENTDIAIEFDTRFKKTNANKEVIVIDDNWTILGQLTPSNSNLANDTWHHIIIKLEDNLGTISNSTNSTVLTFDCTSADRFHFALQNASGDYIDYKDFMIYPI